MKITVTIRELKKYFKVNKPIRINYSSENQTNYQDDPCKINLSFAIMLIFEDLNTICFKSEDNTLCLNRVKKIEIDTESSVLGTILTVFFDEFDPCTIVVS